MLNNDTEFSRLIYILQLMNFNGVGQDWVEFFRGCCDGWVLRREEKDVEPDFNQVNQTR